MSKCINSVRIYKDGKWECANCGSISCGEEVPPVRNYWTKSKCECGALHTSDKNCHSFWCPLYKKD